MNCWAFDMFGVRAVVLLVVDPVRSFLFELKVSWSRENKGRGMDRHRNQDGVRRTRDTQ